MESIPLTEELQALLFQIPLFRDLPKNVQSSLLEKLAYTVYQVDKNEIILRQNTLCKHLYVLLKGKLRVDIIDALGNEVLIEYIVAPRAFATPHLFKTDGTLPATFTVLNEGVLFTATKDSVFQLISEFPDILKSFLCISGNCTKCTVTRLRALSHKNIRSRFIVYLFEQKKAHNSNPFEIEHNQVQLADYLCITRPALSKEINKMVKEQLITIKGKKVEILEESTLRRLIL